MGVTSNTWRLVGLGAVALGFILLLAILWRGGDDPAVRAEAEPAAEAPASPEPEPEPENAAVASEPGCLLDVTSAVIADGEDGGLPTGFGSFDVSARAIQPAKAVATDQIELFVKTSSLNCSATEGVLGLRGGVRLTADDRVLELRRFRLDVGSSRVTMFTRSTGQAGIRALSVNLDDAQRLDDGRKITLLAPMRLTSVGTLTLNSSLDIQLVPGQASLGNLVITGNRRSSSPEVAE